MNVADCVHDRIYHETKSKVYCKDCRVPMQRNRGDWIPDPTELAIRKKEQNDRPDP